MVGGFTSSCEAKNASMSEAPSSSHSGRAACAFKMISSSGGKLFASKNLPHKRQRAPCVRKNLSRSELNEPPTLLNIICVFLIKYHILFVLDTRMLR
ncbi:hypothetical protein CN373_12465 [Bacillus cereus]|nr:hypothetical protein CN373_12465 [Bacillus cereus]PFR22026.1 hypothetical protein COK19_21375 [Bacillus cereus]PGZ13473.1 hypothetical protein COE46_20915 [Bacillus cereus]